MIPVLNTFLYFFFLFLLCFHTLFFLSICLFSKSLPLLMIKMQFQYFFCVFKFSGMFFILLIFLNKTIIKNERQKCSGKMHIKISISFLCLGNWAEYRQKASRENFKLVLHNIYTI